MATLAEVNAEIERRQGQQTLQQQVNAEVARRNIGTDVNEDIGALEAAAIGAGRGLTTIGRAVGLADPEDPAVTKAFKGLQEKHPISTTVGQVAGETAPFLIPGAGIGAIAGTGARVAATAALGAAEGGLITKGLGGDVEQQLTGGSVGGTVAGIAELVLPHVLRAGGALVRRVLGKEPAGAVIDAAGNPSAELTRALKESGQTFEDLTKDAAEEITGKAIKPDQAARKAILETQGLTPTTAQITRDAGDFQAQQESAKLTGRVRTALEGQEAALTSRFDNAVLGTGGDAVTDISPVSEALVSKATVLDQEISDLYKTAREAAPGKQNVKLSNLGKKLKDLAPSNRVTGGAIESIVGDLQAKGVLDDSMKVVGKIDVETAEDVRKLMNELFDPQNGFRNGKLRELKDALDDDVFRASGGDVFKAGRKAKADFEKELARAKISKFDSRKANLVRDVLENKINPDAFANDVVFSKKWRADDIKQLKDYISTDEAGRAAFDDLRAETMEAIKAKSFFGPEDAQGNQALSRDKLQKALQSIGTPKLKVLFTPDENKFLRDMLAVAKLREPVRGTALGKGPSAQAIGALEEKLNALPLIGRLISAIAVDAQGRAVLKAAPELIEQPLKRLPAGPSIAAGALGASTLQDQQATQVP